MKAGPQERCGTRFLCDTEWPRMLNPNGGYLIHHHLLGLSLDEPLREAL